MEVGVRELRNQLRRWLDAVGRGEELTITERGKPVARLIGASSPPPLTRLIAEGVITPAKRPRRQNRAHHTVEANGSVSELVLEQRR
jgi:prevent-host-death family protein